MKRMLTLVAHLLPCCAAGAAQAESLPDAGPAAAAAPEPEPEGSIAMAALLGYGFGGGDATGDANLFGVGYGARAGYVYPSNVYLGGTLLRYLGPADDVYDYDTFTLDLELGYEIGSGPFKVRPSFGLGALLAIIDSQYGGNSALRPQVVPSLLAQYSIGIVRVGAEARWAIVTSYPHALSLLGSVGVAF
jgi:hypothetical protein